MLNNGNKREECGFADDIVAYIYDEIGHGERGKFESHLAGCAACTDEFAGISNARFAMFEWQKEEFGHLSTPEIVIPYTSKAKNAEAVGLFAGLRDLLTLSGWTSAIMVAGAVIICIGLGFVAVNYVGNGSQTAENKKAIVSDPSVSPILAQNQQSAPAVPSVPPSKESNLSGTPITASTKATPGREIRPVRASLSNQRIRFGKSLTASTRVAPPPIKQRKAPALTAFEDEDDKSLRLADLFDEDGV